MHNRHLAMDTNYDLWLLNVIFAPSLRIEKCNLMNMISKFILPTKALPACRSFLEILALVAKLLSSIILSFLKNNNLKITKKYSKCQHHRLSWATPPTLALARLVELSLVAANCGYRIFRHLSGKIILTFAWFTHILSNTKFSCIKKYLKVVTWHHHKPSKC